MPDNQELEEFYQGFLFAADSRNLDKVRTPATRAWLRDQGLGPDARVLDIGGGGGFFCRTVEDFRMGQSWYLDLDREACSFAEKTLNLARVFHGDLSSFAHEHPGKSFDFIYCRHVIEHLPNPVELIDSATSLLAPGGKLVVQCPNGLSREGILQPHRWRHFRKLLADSNNRSQRWAQSRMLTGQAGWGLDPLRHLWAISPKGLRALCQSRPNWRARVYTASLFHPTLSPYACRSRLRGKAFSALSRAIFGPILGGAHLVVEIKLASNSAGYIAPGNR